MNARRQAAGEPAEDGPSPREKRLFLAVLQRPAPKRKAYLRRRSWFQPRLRRRVEALLAAHDESTWLEDQRPWPTGKGRSRFARLER